jgi:hypothetical protein
VSPEARLDRVEGLLDKALEDLKCPNREAPAARCASALAEAATELQAFAQVRNEIGLPRATLLGQLSGLAARLRRTERLLASTAKFYSGWCAAAPAADYPAPGCSGQNYQPAGWSNDPAPALLAFRG